MKNILILLFFFSLNVSAQFGGCTCNDNFDSDIRSKITNYERQDVKAMLYEYFSSSVEKQKAMKQSLNYGSVVNTIIDGLPLTGEVNFGFSNDKKSVVNIVQESIKDRYISDENLNVLIRSYVPDIAWSSYDNCIEGCNRYAEITSEGGMTLRNISQSDDQVILELRFVSNPPNGKNRIRKAIYTSGDIIGGRQFTDSLEIVDRQTIYEHIKLDPNKDFSATVSFYKGGAKASYSIKATKRSKNSTDAPLGTIVSSVLNYDQFMQLNGLAKEYDLNDIIWVPCDGREIGTEAGTYGAISGGRVPDLRGLFLRGANNMGFEQANVPIPNSNHLNPNSAGVGKVQLDAVGDHQHSIVGNQFPASTSNTGGIYSVEVLRNINQYKDTKSESKLTEKQKATETKPKNMTVYYYIKIR